jgi:hypothetical protein
MIIGHAKLGIDDTINMHIWPYHPFSAGKIVAGANPTIVIYNASVVNFYNATGSLARFENKNILFSFEKHSSLLQRWRSICKLKKS